MNYRIFFIGTKMNLKISAGKKFDKINNNTPPNLG